MSMTRSEAGKLGALKLIENLLIRYQHNPSFCTGCGTELSYKQRHNKYCSRKCSRKYSNAGRPKKPLKKCLTCNAEFYAKETKRKFCSTACSARHKVLQGFQLIKEGNAVSPAIMKKYLIEIHGERCLDSKCLWDFEERSIGVELEHIDGNSENNILSNCTLLCPNCHSLTSTYKAKNKGNGRHKRRLRYKAGKSY